jgi:hypothetical protein
LPNLLLTPRKPDWRIVRPARNIQFSITRFKSPAFSHPPVNL